MIIGKIRQEGTRLTTDNSDIAYQYSANQVMTVEFGDTTLTGYTLCWYCAFDRAMKKTVILEYDTKTKQITLPASVFEVEGNIYIALRAIKEKEVLSSSPVNFYIGASTNPNASNAPREPGWEEVVQALIDDIFKQEYKEPMDAMIEEAKKQQKLAATLETAANNATVATNAANSATTKANEATKKALEATKQAEVALHDQDKLDATVADVTEKHRQIMDFMQNTGSGELIQGLQGEIQTIKDFIGLDDSIYGVEVDLPNRKYTRLGGAKNLLPGSDFDNIGPWKRRRCMMVKDGTVLAYYGDPNYEYHNAKTKVDFEVNGKVYPNGTFFLCMVEQPKFYYKIIPKELEPAEGGGYHMRKFSVYISPTSKQGFKVHPAFVRNGEELDFIYLSNFQGTDNVTAMGSYGGLGVYPKGYPSRDKARELVHYLGNGWELRDSFAKGLTTLLLLVEYNTLEASVIGAGNIKNYGTWGQNINGYTQLFGNGSGSAERSELAKDSWDSRSVVYRGEENLWGNNQEWLEGINVHVVNGKAELYYARGGFAENIATTPYKKLNATLPVTGGYTSAFIYTGEDETDTLFLPSEVVDNRPTLKAYYTGYKSDGWYYCVANGGINSLSSLHYLGLADATDTTLSIGGRLMYLPDTSTKDSQL